MPNDRYLEVNSQYRDRNEWSIPAEFDIPLSQSTFTNGRTAIDPIIDGYPFYPTFGSPLPVFTGGTALNPILDANASTIDNFYINDIIEDVTLGEFRKIIFYDGATQTATLESAFLGGWAAADSFQIRHAVPIESGALVGGTTTTFVIPGTSSSVDNFYNNNYIFITSGAASGDVRRIINYVGSTRTGTVTPSFSSTVVAADTYEILNFTRDNLNQMDYRGSSLAQQNECCYEISLVNLILPNETLYAGNGGLPSLFPYFYVSLTTRNNSTSGSMTNTIYSNNPNATCALFRCPVDDIQTPLISPFIIIHADGMCQTVKFKPNSNLHLKVFLPNGELFRTRADNMSPLRPDPMLQISVLFKIRKI